MQKKTVGELVYRVPGTAQRRLRTETVKNTLKTGHRDGIQLYFITVTFPDAYANSFPNNIDTL